MKILLVNCTYKEGSTGKILEDTANYLQKQGHEVVVAYGGVSQKRLVENDLKAHQIRTITEARIHVRMVRAGLVMMYGGLLFAYFRLRNLIKKEKPDLVHIHCINGYTVNIFRILKFLGKNKIKTVVTHHAEFYYTGSCGHAYCCTKFINEECRGCESLKEATGTNVVNYAHRSWKRMKDAFRGFDKDNLLFTAVSTWVKSRSEKSPIVNDYPCKVVENGINTDIFKFRPQRNIFDEIIKHPFSKVVLHATGIFCPDDKDHIKGGWYVLELAKAMPDVAFVIVATSIHTKQRIPQNVYLWGHASSQEELAALYSSADATLLTSRRETFSMIVAESLCCGTPVVGFEAGGPETITIKEFSSFVTFGDIDKMKFHLRKVLSTNWNKSRISQKGIEKFDRNIMANNYMLLYQELVSKEEKKYSND